ncbi:monocarboxylate transporter [Brachionus plicatilis]|uniref:Monocarboxylate transporter n=1 Tax=Brachionus plicatilis TaxID=10195 RepID=A0A3M7SE21_BRAPC|nr:monocarboxylate transporter [Brachionus plicatilis]
MNDKYGLVIIFLSILTRIFIVSIAWNFGVFITAIKSSIPGSFHSELGWITGLAQGMGSLICPVYILISNKIGIRLTFFIGIVLCFISMIASSFVPNEHFLFLTYSLPFGIGSSILFVLGSVVTGKYYPPEHKYHVTANVTISLGFPLGYFIINPLNESLLEYYDWRMVFRIYGIMICFLILMVSPLFTDKYSNSKQLDPLNKEEVAFNDEFLNISSKHLSWLVRILWLVGIVANSIANTSILTHLNGYFLSTGATTAELKADFFLLGFSDALIRVLLALIGPYVKKNLSAIFVLASFFGFILSNLWADHIIPLFNTIYCIMFGICPAVLMSLMYVVNSEISGTYDLERSYTINVMMNGLGIIVGPILSGFLLDNSNNDYDRVFKMAYRFYFICIVSYSLMKFILLKYSVTISRDSKENVKLNGYAEFKNEF